MGYFGNKHAKKTHANMDNNIIIPLCLSDNNIHTHKQKTKQKKT